MVNSLDLGPRLGELCLAVVKRFFSIAQRRNKVSLIVVYALGKFAVGLGELLVFVGKLGFKLTGKTCENKGRWMPISVAMV